MPAVTARSRRGPGPGTGPGTGQGGPGPRWTKLKGGGGRPLSSGTGHQGAGAAPGGCPGGAGTWGSSLAAHPPSSPPPRWSGGSTPPPHGLGRHPSLVMIWGWHSAPTVIWGSPSGCADGAGGTEADPQGRRGCSCSKTTGSAVSAQTPRGVGAAAGSGNPARGHAPSRSFLQPSTFSSVVCVDPGPLPRGGDYCVCFRRLSPGSGSESSEPSPPPHRRLQPEEQCPASRAQQGCREPAFKGAQRC